MTAWNGFSFSWDALDRMTALVGNGLARRFAFTADGERVLEREGSSYSFSLRGIDNRVLREMKATWTGAGWSWAWEKDSIWGAGRLVASVSASDGIRHAHVDHLGSPRLLTNRCGQRVALLDHNPWGLDRPTGVQDGERHRFTAHQRDLGLLDRTWDDFDHMHARTYWPSLGRFMSVDPLRGTPLRPQSLNLFGYVEGRPVSFIDPWGLQAYDPGLRETIQVMGEDPCSEAPAGVSCEEYRTANQFMRRMLWESARQRAQEREDPMLTILREVGSIFPRHPPCPGPFLAMVQTSVNQAAPFVGLPGEPSVIGGLLAAATNSPTPATSLGLENPIPALFSRRLWADPRFAVRAVGGGVANGLAFTGAMYGGLYAGAALDWAVFKPCRF